MKIAFYAPLKPPDHPVPSGDRLMANLLMQAMRLVGHDVEVASRFRAYTRSPVNHQLDADAEAERHRISAGWALRSDDQVPQVWFTYHPYYKAPDLIGPELTRARRIAYVTAEASYAGKRDLDRWAKMQARVKSAVSGAHLNFCLTPVDREGLMRFADPDRLCDLPPFIDATDLQAGPRAQSAGPVALVTVAMMRPGVKIESYRILAQTLDALSGLDWTLTIVGDGSERDAVEAMFANLPSGRVSFTGELNRTQLSRQLTNHDIFVWPGIGEAYGLAYLEAQASGLPVVAIRNQGVPSVVADQRTGLLSSEENLAEFSENLKRLIGDASLRRKMGAAAERFVHGERSIDVAAEIIDQGLKRAVAAASQT